MMLRRYNNREYYSYASGNIQLDTQFYMLENTPIKLNKLKWVFTIVYDELKLNLEKHFNTIKIAVLSAKNSNLVFFNFYFIFYT